MQATFTDLVGSAGIAANITGLADTHATCLSRELADLTPALDLVRDNAMGAQASDTAITGSACQSLVARCVRAPAGDLGADGALNHPCIAEAVHEASSGPFSPYCN